MLIHLLIALLLIPPVAVQSERGSASDAEELKKLVAKVASGEGLEADQAAEDLIEKVLAPIVAALDSVESRPAEQRKRVQAVLGRLAARLRMRLYRSSLPENERRLLDEFIEFNSQLVEQLFDDRFENRLSAVRQIPAAPDSGAGVLAVAMVYAEDEKVTVAALHLARRLADKVVIRELTRYVRDSTAAFKQELFRPGEHEKAASIALYVGEAIKVLGDLKAKSADNAVAEALQYFSHSPYRRIFFIGTSPSAVVGELWDVLHGCCGPRTIKLLLGMLGDREILANRALGRRKLLTRTVGDAALHNLLLAFELKPGDFGFETEPATREDAAPLVGFFHKTAREKALEKFKTWMKENHPETKLQKAPAASQPGGSGRRP